MIDLELNHLKRLFEQLRIEFAASYAAHGHHEPLDELLNSDRPISRDVREYLSEEKARAPDKRFRRRPNARADLYLREDDQILVHQVLAAKHYLAIRNLGDGTRLNEISDKAALDCMSEVGIQADEDRLRNAKRRIDKWLGVNKSD